MPRTICLIAFFILIMAIDVCESRIRVRVRSRVRVGSGGGGTGGFSWSSFGVIMAIIFGSFFGTIIIMAILTTKLLLLYDINFRSAGNAK